MNNFFFRLVYFPLEMKGFSVPILEIYYVTVFSVIQYGADIMGKS